MKTGKLTAQVLQAALKKYLQHRAKSKNTLHHGQQSLKQLKKHGVALSNIEITEANIGAFKPCAKKYGVDFTLRKDKTTQPPHYVVIFKSKDADNLEQAFREFTAKTLSKEQRPSIRKVLSAVKQKVAAQTKQRAKEKIEERGAGAVKPDVRKLLILNLPYLIFVYLFGKVGQAYRLAAGADLSGKLLHLADGFTAAFATPLPSLHLFDFCVGIAGALIVRLVVYCKGKNAKKYRKGVEYGSARWSA